MPTTHRKYKSPEYVSWTNMKARCNNRNRPDFKHYGGRGIKVCRRWAKFENFLADMGERPEGFSLDRINNDLNYTPKNCRWASVVDQRNNRRNCRKLKHRGEALTLGQWATKLGVSRSLLKCRIKRGYTLSETLTAALFPRGPNAIARLRQLKKNE